MLLIMIKLIVMSIVFYLKYFGGSWNRLYLSRWVVEWKSLGTPVLGNKLMKHGQLPQINMS